MPRVMDLICDVINEAGIDHVFGLPGGCADFLMEVFYARPEHFKVITAHHEGSASFMADMYGRITRKPAVLIGQGPFIASNGGLGIMEAYHAGVPMIVLTETSDYHGNGVQGVYQSATGEYGTIDIRNIFKGMCKYVGYATTPYEAVYCTQLAVKHAISGRPGPACVIVRYNVMTSAIDDLNELQVPLYPLEGHINVSPPCISDDDANKIANLLVSAERPIMICGRGTHAARAYGEVKELAELIGMPVATSYQGKSILPEIHDLALGVMEKYGSPLTDATIQKADVILAVGTCLAPDNTNNCSPEFINVKKQKLIQIDIEPRNAGWTYPLTIGVTSDAKLALQKIIEKIKSKIKYFTYDVNKRIADLKKLKQDPTNEFFSSAKYDLTDTPIEPESIVKIFNELIGEEHVLILDAGNNRAWFTRLLQTNTIEQIYGAGGVASMAYGPSASLAAAMLKPDKKVICIVGDSSFMMTPYVLSAAQNHNLPISFVILNDSAYGNVRDVLSRKGKDISLNPDIDYAKIAQGFGVEGLTVESYEDLRSALNKALNTKQLMLLDIKINKKASHLRIRRS